jgi:hypothetical protein
MIANPDFNGRKITLCFLLVLSIVFVVPIFVYGAVSSFTGMQVPGGSAVTFLAGVLISKIGTAIALVALFYTARDTFVSQWLLYAFVWWVMFTLGEIGQAIGPGYTWTEATSGMISEAIYFPLVTYVMQWFFRPQV